MFGFHGAKKDNRSSRAAVRLTPAAFLMGIIATFAITMGVAVMTAPASVAAEINTTNQAQDDAEGPKEPTPTTPSPTRPGGTVGVQVNPTLNGTEYVNFEAWFYENTKTGSIPSPYGAAPINYDWVANLCGGTSADRSYPFAGNAIPIANSSTAGGTTRLVWVKWSTAVEFHSNNYTYTQTGTVTTTDPVTGVTTTTPYYDVIGSATQRWNIFKYTISCKFQTSPVWQSNECVTYGDTKIDGPYDQSWAPMTSVAGGGTNRRVPGPGTSIGVIGQKTEKPSLNLGRKMELDGQNPKTDTPNLPNVWANCVPNSGNTFNASLTEDIDSLGRYDATINQWWSRTWFQVFNTSNWQNVYKGVAAMNGGSTSQVQIQGGTGYYIRSIGAPTLRTTHDYFKIICASGSDPSGTVAVRYVAQGSTASRTGVAWGDSDPSYYTWNCGDTPGASSSSSAADDFLQCQNYTSPSGTIIVDGKIAAPLQSVNQVINGAVVDVVKKGDTYYIASAADPVHATWQQIRINTRSGQNVNTAGKNVVWDYNYKLADWSSPLLKNKDKNSLDQPYHGWEDKTADSVLAAEVPLDTKWEPDKFYEYQTLAYTYTTKPYTYSIQYSYLPYTYYTETRQTGTESYACGTYSYACGSYSYACGSYSYQCGGGYWITSSGGATYYWWVNGGRGGYACPSGWWLSGSTCYTNTYIPPSYCTGTNYCTGTSYCSRPTYGTFTVKNAAPSGYFDNGSSYQKNTTVKDPAPAGYFDDGTQYKMLNPPPYGYTDTGNGVYTSTDKLNTTGKTGGIAFDKWRKWPSNTGLSACTVNMSDYSSALTGTYSLMCGDNVTDSIRGAYFRFFMSSTAGSQGWQVTPWARVTVDVQASFKQVNGFTMNPDGTISLGMSDATTKWVRQSYDCPAQPLKIMVERTVGD